MLMPKQAHLDSRIKVSSWCTSHFMTRPPLASPSLFFPTFTRLLKSCGMWAGWRESGQYGKHHLNHFHPHNLHLHHFHHNHLHLNPHFFYLHSSYSSHVGRIGVAWQACDCTQCEPIKIPTSRFHPEEFIHIERNIIKTFLDKANDMMKGYHRRKTSFVLTRKD